MTTISDARRVLNARACFALVELAYALDAGRLTVADLPTDPAGAALLTEDEIRAGHDCIMTGNIERKTLDAEVRACVAPLVNLGGRLQINDPDRVLIADSRERPLLTARHLEWARRAGEPMTEAQARALVRTSVV